MSTPTKSEYMLLFRGTDWHKNLSPEEIQQVVNQMKAWFDRLTAEGKAKAGKATIPRRQDCFTEKRPHVDRRSVCRIQRSDWRLFLLEVGNLDEAAEIAKDFPCLEYGATVEVRPVAPECMVGETVQQKSARQARVRERLAFRFRRLAAIARCVE